MNDWSEIIANASLWVVDHHCLLLLAFVVNPPLCSFSNCLIFSAFVIYKSKLLFTSHFVVVSY